MARSTVERNAHPKYERLYLLRRARSKFYYAETFIDGRKARKSVKASVLPVALKLAEDWYKKLLRASVSDGRQHPINRLATDPTVAEMFSSYRSTLPPSKREYADMKWSTIQHFWRTLDVTEINAQTFRDFYKWRRRTKTQRGTTIKNHSLHKDMMIVRQILKFAIEEGHIETLPIIPKVGKIAANPRPWFNRDEYLTLMATSTERIDEARKAGQTRVAAQRADLEDFLNFMLETQMRVNEVRTLTVGQCRIVTRKGADTYIQIDALGKTGHRTVVGGFFAAAIFEGRASELKLRPGDRLWPHSQRDAFRELLIAANLRTDAFGNDRNLKSMRATAIAFRILAGVDLFMIARNAGTSVAMIDTFYCRRLSSEMGAKELSQTVLGTD